MLIKKGFLITQVLVLSVIIHQNAPYNKIRKFNKATDIYIIKNPIPEGFLLIRIIDIS